MLLVNIRKKYKNIPKLMTKITVNYGDFRLRGNDGDITTGGVKPNTI